MNFRFAGAGPGVQARDGCSVELYRRLPYFGELEEYRALFPPGVQVVELGCGAGRLTGRLLDWGVHVTAVDNCPEMLAALPNGASPVLSDIESLNLDRRFEVTLLASCLINHPAADARFAFVATVEMTLRYEIAGNVWRHSFVVAALDEADVEALLSQTGFGSFAWSGTRKRWLSAVVQ